MSNWMKYSRMRKEGKRAVSKWVSGECIKESEEKRWRRIKLGEDEEKNKEKGLSKGKREEKNN